MAGVRNVRVGHADPDEPGGLRIAPRLALDRKLAGGLHDALFMPMTSAVSPLALFILVNLTRLKTVECATAAMDATEDSDTCEGRNCRQARSWPILRPVCRVRVPGHAAPPCAEGPGSAPKPNSARRGGGTLQPE